MEALERVAETVGDTAAMEGEPAQGEAAGVAVLPGDEAVVYEAVLDEAVLDESVLDEQVAEPIDGHLELDDDQAVAAVEALIFVSGEPLSLDLIKEATALSDDRITAALQQLEQRYRDAAGGIELVRVAAKYQFRTKAWTAPFVRALKAGAPRRLSRAALETLAIVAYRQPIVKSDVEKIRGVDATPTLKTLLDRRLLKIVGHKAAVGQPALYGTTEDFLKMFGLASLAELPTLRDIRELEQDPGEVGAAYAEDFDEAAALEEEAVELAGEAAVELTGPLASEADLP